MNFQHKRITKFGIEGSIYDESHVDRLKAEYLSLLVLQMKADGYVRRTDIDPQFTFFYDGPRNGFSFKLSVYGIYVGKRMAQKLAGVDDYRPIFAAQKKQESRQKKITGTT